MTSSARARAWTSRATEGHLDLVNELEDNGRRKTKECCRRERDKDNNGNRTNA